MTATVLSIAGEYRAALQDAARPPCLSLYQPTHRRHPENQQDPIRFRNLVRALESSLLAAHPAGEARRLLAPFLALADDAAFWNRTLDGLAVLGAGGACRAYRLRRPVPEIAVVADSFHTKPLLRLAQSADRFHVLALSRGSVRLFEGNRDALDEVTLAAGVPRTLTDALGDEVTEPHLGVTSHSAGAAGAAMFHGQGSRKDEVDRDTERFFRAVDRAVTRHHSATSGLPLILAALPEHHAPFRAVSHNPHLVGEGIEANPDALAPDALCERAWTVLEPRYLARLAALVEAFGSSRAQGRGADDPAAIALAAVAGRVATLLIDADRHVPGRIDPATGRLEPAALAQPDVDDALDDLGELVLAKKGEVVVVPSARMPSPTGAAAIFRF